MRESRFESGFRRLELLSFATAGRLNFDAIGGPAFECEAVLPVTWFRVGRIGVRRPWAFHRYPQIVELLLKSFEAGGASKWRSHHGCERRDGLCRDLLRSGVASVNCLPKPDDPCGI